MTEHTSQQLRHVQFPDDFGFSAPGMTSTLVQGHAAAVADKRGPVWQADIPRWQGTDVSR